MKLLDPWTSNEDIRVEIEISFNSEILYIQGEPMDIHKDNFLFEPINQPFSSIVVRFGVDALEDKISVLFKPDSDMSVEEFEIQEMRVLDSQGEEINNEESEDSLEFPGYLDSFEGSQNKILEDLDTRFNCGYEKEENEYYGKFDDVAYYEEKLEEPEMEKITGYYPFS
jgi:hypothetical protein